MVSSIGRTRQLLNDCSIAERLERISGALVELGLKLHPILKGVNRLELILQNH